MARTPFIAGNWKMHGTMSEAMALASELKALLAGTKGVRIAVAPTFTSLQAVAGVLRGTGLELAAQNVHWERQGAFTGEVSTAMLRECGCTCVIVGHSERRQHFGETDEGVKKRAAAALAGGLTPIVCVGETLEQREAGHTHDVVSTQVRAALGALPAEDLSRVVVAYEPVWAIGTGRNATAAQAQEVHALIRGLLRERAGAVADEVILQYGGSVKPENAAEILSQPDVDGALVGGASLQAGSFAAIVNAARG